MIENVGKGLTVPKRVLIVWPKMAQNFSAQHVCPSTKVWDFDEKKICGFGHPGTYFVPFSQILVHFIIQRIWTVSEMIGTRFSVI